MVKVSGEYDQVWRRKPEDGIFDFGKVNGNPIEYVLVETGLKRAFTW